MEKYTISFVPEARKELLNAYLWYQSEQPGLEKKFREYFRTKINLIKENPKSSSYTYKNVRSARMKTFPYNIIYRISNSDIQIIAVFHHARSPREWKKRI